jgi:hypothetical protein
MEPVSLVHGSSGGPVAVLVGVKPELTDIRKGSHHFKVDPEVLLVLPKGA